METLSDALGLGRSAAPQAPLAPHAWFGLRSMRQGERVSGGRVRGAFSKTLLDQASEDEDDHDNEHESLLFPSPRPLSPRGEYAIELMRGARGGRFLTRGVISWAMETLSDALGLGRSAAPQVQFSFPIFPQAPMVRA